MENTNSILLTTYDAIINWFKNRSPFAYLVFLASSFTPWHLVGLIYFCAEPSIIGLAKAVQERRAEIAQSNAEGK